jgi:prepilin-type N-terminal cleavage/methylation domain-containing protein
MKATQQSNRGFTIVEILFAMTVFLLVLAGALPMYVQSSKSIYIADSKLDVNNEIRKLNNHIIGEAREADAFILYDNFDKTWIDGSLVDFRNSSCAGKGRLRDGEKGKFLLLLFFGVDDKPYDSIPAPVDHMIGMYLDTDGSETVGPLKIFTKDNIDDKITLEENIPLFSSRSDHEILIEEMTGLMDGDVFYNFGGRSVMINGKIARKNGAIKGTNTYNFTITPR